MENENIEAIAQYAMKATRIAEQLDVHITIEVPSQTLFPLAEWFRASIIYDYKNPPFIKLRGVTLKAGQGRRDHVGYYRR